MLVLRRKVGQSFFIGDASDIEIKVLTNEGDYIRIGVGAPKDILIRREEITKDECDELNFSSMEEL